MTKPLERNAKIGMKRSGAGGATNASRPLTETRTPGGAGMAVDSQYTDSESVFKTEQPTNNWQRIGAVIVREIAPQIVLNVKARSQRGQDGNV